MTIIGAFIVRVGPCNSVFQGRFRNTRCQRRESSRPARITEPRVFNLLANGGNLLKRARKNAHSYFSARRERLITEYSAFPAEIIIQRRVSFFLRHCDLRTSDVISTFLPSRFSKRSRSLSRGENFTRGDTRERNTSGETVKSSSIKSRREEARRGEERFRDGEFIYRVSG